MNHPSSTDASFFDKPRNINLMIGVLVVLCLATVLADLFYTNPHAHFDIETTFGFQAWFGFLAFVIIVFLGRAMRLIVKRPEDYYDPDGTDIGLPVSGDDHAE